MSNQKIMLPPITDQLIDDFLLIHKKQGGKEIDIHLKKLFECFNNESDFNDVYIKVAALNTIYSTAIKNIFPVVQKIVDYLKNKHLMTRDEYKEAVDAIAYVKWTNENTHITYERRNISFASKYLHFLSGYEIPIYDSYIWIIMIGYLRQNNHFYLKFRAPKTYKEFHLTYELFLDTFKLHHHSAYDIDKFLWQMGMHMIQNQQNKETGQITLEQAKSIVRKLL